MKVKLKRFSSRADVPILATPGSACFDVFSSRSVTLEPGVTRKIEIDFGLKFSKKYAAKLLPHAGLSLKPISLGTGGIDLDFRENICVILTNLPQRTIEIETGDRIAQLIFLKKEQVDFVEAEEFDDKTFRDTKGFGSTGMKSPVPC